MKMLPLQFQKLQQALDWYGVGYVFTHAAKDKFGQPTSNAPVMNPVKGIFSESGSNFTFVISEGGTNQSKPAPTITTRMSEARKIARDDIVQIPPTSTTGRKYRVTSVNDIGNFGLFAGISLEVVTDGELSV